MSTSQSSLLLTRLPAGVQALLSHALKTSLVAKPPDITMLIWALSEFEVRPTTPAEDSFCRAGHIVEPANFSPATVRINIYADILYIYICMLKIYISLYMNIGRASSDGGASNAQGVANPV